MGKTKTKLRPNPVGAALRKIAPKLQSAALFSPKHFRALAANFKLLQKAFPDGVPGTGTPLHPDALVDQLFDSLFLSAGPMYLRSRQMFVREGGVFEARLTTSPRSLSSLILTENRVEYTPHQSEFLWTLDQKPFPRESIQRLTTYSTSLFHEQNHRLLWKRVAPPGVLDEDSIRQYLNFMEALVVTLDMALGDELGPEISSLGYLTGTLYDPGTEIPRASPRAYRNALHRALQATFLALEGYEPARIESVLLKGVERGAANLERRMVQRALRLDREFIERTNPGWQNRYAGDLGEHWSARAVRKQFASPGATEFQPSSDPLIWTQEYLIAERVFDEWAFEIS